MSLLFLPLLLQAAAPANTIVEADPTAWIRGAILGALGSAVVIAFSALIGVLIKRYFDRSDRKMDQRTLKEEEKEKSLETLKTKVLSIEKNMEDVQRLAGDANRRSTYNEGRFAGFEEHLKSIQEMVQATLAQIRETP